MTNKIEKLNRCPINYDVVVRTSSQNMLDSFKIVGRRDTEWEKIYMQAIETLVDQISVITKNSPQPDLGTLIRNEIKRQKKTQVSVANAVGISKNTISEICNNKSMPHKSTLDKIYEILEINVDYKIR